MSPTLLFSFVLAYFALLLAVAWYTSRNSNNESFFIGNKNSNWMLVAFGMIGTSLSGVTFVSVPGTVATNAFSYMQVVFGYLIGYVVIAYVLLPLYYRLNLTSIYNYLQQRFGFTAYKTGALFFIISRTVGATARLYLVINVMQLFILDRLGVPFWVTAMVILLMILLYTFEGGVKTIVYTDTLQTSFMLLGLVVCVFYIMNNLGYGFGEAMSVLSSKGYTNVFDWDPNSKGFFWKHLIGGACITIAMTGLDQEMMQKNISVKNLKDSQKNMMTFSVVIVFVNFLFLLLGGLLYVYAANKGLDVKGDDLFPTIALSHLPNAIAIIFIIALISALFPSADGALTALTSSFCIDILGIRRRKDMTDAQQKRTRMTVHLTFTVVFMICILVFKVIDNKSIIGVILDLAGYTYGPLLGLFAFGILTKRTFPDNLMVTVICLIAPAICYLISKNAANWFGGFQIGIELLLINGLLTFLGLLSISKKQAIA
ncbi:sodium:solute symporter [Flavihumibacter rivuli]|uniref:sodium:solute symporter n=1 Tax=Flavihumibacter rivuli TaxID=2838156 RepID=UPI001BDE9F19|nr:sodium:solute symporter [Flavihumibacter rivuli]ULQ58287.1 sodium:solute symporter [Flavihumibacter rivuli]